MINPQIHVLDDGQLFPFVSSTGLVAEWAFAALDHVSRDVSKEVQEALFALKDHAESIELEEKLRCDTTPEIAELALAAQRSGSLVGFRTARSYFDVRTKQEAAGFLMKNEKGNLECIKGETLYHDIRCPADHYKLTEADFEASCEKAGKECKNGYLCYCKPCVKAYEVDIFQYHPGEFDNSTEVYNQEGCDKMSLCAQGEQVRHLRLLGCYRKIDCTGLTHYFCNSYNDRQNISICVSLTTGREKIQKSRPWCTFPFRL